MTHVDEAFLAERERILNGASPLPWMDATLFEDLKFYQAIEMLGRDFKFLVDARHHQQALIDEVRRLQGEVKRMSEVILAGPANHDAAALLNDISDKLGDAGYKELPLIVRVGAVLHELRWLRDEVRRLRAENASLKAALATFKLHDRDLQTPEQP